MNGGRDLMLDSQLADKGQSELSPACAEEAAQAFQWTSRAEPDSWIFFFSFNFAHMMH